MRKIHLLFIALTLLTVILSAGCTKIPGVVDYIPFRDIPAEYSLDDARADNCVVYENSDITSGQEIWDYVLSEGERLYINDLFFDRNKYVIKYREDGKEVRKVYKYMKMFEGKPSSDTAAFSRYLRYVLVNNSDVTWEDIVRGMFSSQSGDWIDHKTVYADLTFPVSPCGD